jgi:hypothetical protein
MSRIDSAAETALPDLTRHDAYPTLRAHLALCGRGAQPGGREQSERPVRTLIGGPAACRQYANVVLSASAPGVGTVS